MCLRILKTLCRKLKLPDAFDYQRLARLTPGYVGADLMALCRAAAMNAVNRVLIGQGGGPPEGQGLTEDHDQPRSPGAQAPPAQEPPQVRPPHTLELIG